MQMEECEEEADMMMEEAMPMRSMAAAPQMMSAQTTSMASSMTAPQKKSKSKATSNIGGKKRLNDEVSAQLFKMSKY